MRWRSGWKGLGGQTDLRLGRGSRSILGLIPKENTQKGTPVRKTLPEGDHVRPRWGLTTLNEIFIDAICEEFAVRLLVLGKEPHRVA